MHRHAQANGWVDAVARGALGLFVGSWVGAYGGGLVGALLPADEVDGHLQPFAFAAWGAVVGAILAVFWFLADCPVPWRRRRRRRTVTP